jgi:2-amino-4-hydroxy-6-hydroxymethyldihydropteridine diphosphokinase
MAERVVIAFGSNLGDREEMINQAIERIKESVAIARVSALIETDPVGGPQQGKYLNGVLIGSTELSEDELMERLLEIEASLGRIRTVPNAPRTIDLDLIDYDGAIRQSPSLTLPHPRAHQRFFVMAPWAEIDPEATLVGIGSVRELCEINGWRI